MADSERLYEFRTRRIRRSFAHEGSKVRGPEDVANLLYALTKDLDREHFYAIYIDASGKLVGFEVVAIGGLSGVEVAPRELFRGAILAGACSVILGHNHPSGDSTPSVGDRQLTVRFHKAGELLGIPVLDHVVVGHDNFTSLANEMAL